MKLRRRVFFPAPVIIRILRFVIMSLSSCHVTFVTSFSHPYSQDHQSCHHKRCHHKCFLSKSESNVRKQSWVQLILSISISRPSLLDAFLTRRHLHHHSTRGKKNIITTTSMIVEPTQEQHHNQLVWSISSSLAWSSLPKSNPLMKSNILDGSSDAHGCHHHHVRPREVLLSLYFQLSWRKYS